MATHVAYRKRRQQSLGKSGLEKSDRRFLSTLFTNSPKNDMMVDGNLGYGKDVYQL
jgi:hypothetical protein